MPPPLPPCACLRWGEALVYCYLLSHPEVSSGQWSVHWANKDAESGRPYDLLLLPPGCR